ncbi:MAG: class I tRNA ligase family protein, partial [Patescibacteria group bacterium]
WCPKDKIGLANEEAIGGICDRCGSATEKREKEQWMLAITKYADRLDKDLDSVDYPERVKIQQRNWIGKSEGSEIEFKISSGDFIKVFTTRADTLFGVTYIVLAPEHPLVGKLLGQVENKKEVEEYIQKVKKESELERTREDKEKTGIELKGIKAINPANNEEVPVFIADYVLVNYGTGAVMAVPQHDTRDKEFAEKFNLPIIDKPLVDAVEITKKVGGKIVTKFKLRDWVFSRQRYWGEPIPLVNCEKCGLVAVPEKDLPIKLPEVKDYKPTDTGESPLASISKWVNTKCSNCKGKAKRETDTMPNWAGSSWYYLRYIDPKNNKVFADAKKLKYWTPVDWYNGGMEHTTLHLLYSRFWHKFLYDLKLVPTAEPYQKRTSHGMILGEGGVKMSKSVGNVVNPDDIVKIYGADTLRIYEMFMGPFEESVAW